MRENIMKKIAVSFVLIFASITFAQIESFDSEYINEIKQDVWGTYVEIIGDNLALTEEQAEIFMPMLDQYLADQGKVADMRIQNTKDYMMNYYDLNDSTGRALLNKAMEVEQERLNIRREYMDKMLEKLPAPLVGKFFQLDVRIFALIDLVRMSSIPLVRQGEE
jgi:hypothetical protein